MTSTKQDAAAAIQQTPSQIVVASLVAHGVDTIFGLDGDHVIPLFDALADAPTLRIVTVKHENNAAVAAEVYGRLTGRPGVALVTAGPGALNSIAGVAGAYAAGVPMVHISGGVPRDAAKEAFHGVDDVAVLRHAFEPVTKWSVRVEDARDIAAVLQQAFRLAVAGRPGPVHVEIPLSTLQSAPVELPAVEMEPGRVTAVGPAVDVDPLVARLNSAERIAIVAGKGAWWPLVSQRLVQLAERLSAPVAHTWDGHAAMPTVHPLSIGVWRGQTGSHPYAAQAVVEADVVLGVGVRRQTEAANDLAAMLGDRLVLLNVADLPETAVEGETGSVDELADQLARLAERARPRPLTDATRERCATAQALLQRGLAMDLERFGQRRPWHIGLALDALARRMTPEMVVISDVSNIKLWTPLQIPAFNPESHLQPGSWGAMGYAVPGVLAAGLVRPDKKVIGLTGDASFLMASSDFGTICELGLPVVLAIHADGQIGMIQNAMTMTYGRAYATNIGDVDFVRYAEAFGARGIRVDDPTQLDAAWDEALAATEPVLLELKAGNEFPRPWPVERLVRQAETGQPLG